MLNLRGHEINEMKLIEINFQLALINVPRYIRVIR